MPVNSLQAQIAAVEGITATGNIADAGVLKLFTNNPSLTRDSVVGDFVIPTFTGYSPKTALAWGPVFIGSDGIVQAVAPGKLFQRTGGAIDEVVNGWWITNTGGTELVAAGYFDEPVPFTQDLDGVYLDAVIRYGD